MTKKVNEFGNLAGSTLVRRSNFGEWIDECLALTIFIATSPSIYPKPHFHDGSLDGQILKMPVMPTVSQRRLFAASRTRTRHLAHKGRNQPSIA